MWMCDPGLIVCMLKWLCAQAVGYVCVRKDVYMCVCACGVE